VNREVRVAASNSPEQTAAARQAHERNSALRAIEDPRQLARAARIVRVGLERRRLTLADVLPQDRAGGDDAAA
jgi:hypothetical protein